MISEMDFRVSPGYLRHQMDKTRHACRREPLDRKCLHVNRKLRFCQRDVSHGEGHTWSWSREDKNLPLTMNCSQFQEQIYLNSIVNFKWPALSRHLFTWVFLPEKIPPAQCVHWGKFTLERTSSSVSSWGLPPEPPNHLLTLCPGLKLTPTTHHPKSVARKLPSWSIISFFNVIYSQLMDTHTNYTCCCTSCTSSRATCYLKIGHDILILTITVIFKKEKEMLFC